MVLTRNGTETFTPIPAMDLPSPAQSSGPSLMEKAKANENARLANETWFNTFSDGPTLDDLVENFVSWNIYLIEVTTEKNRLELLKSSPRSDPIRKNQAKNIRIFLAKQSAKVLRM